MDLTLLKEKYNDGLINPLCNNNNIKHTLRMTNTSFFNKEFLNEKNSEGRLRATSFDLILFRIPYFDLDPDRPQIGTKGLVTTTLILYLQYLTIKTFQIDHQIGIKQQL